MNQQDTAVSRDDDIEPPRTFVKDKQIKCVPSSVPQERRGMNATFFHSDATPPSPINGVPMTEGSLVFPCITNYIEDTPRQVTCITFIFPSLVAFYNSFALIFIGE